MNTLMSLEKSLVFIKPDHIEFADEILDDYGLRIATAFVDKVPRETIRDHYSLHIGKNFFEYMTEAYVGKSISLAVYQGSNVIHDIIQIVGETDPSKSPKYTIRARYSGDSMKRAISEGRTLRNVIHRSDSLEEALREINVWQSFLNQ